MSAEARDLRRREALAAAALALASGLAVAPASARAAGASDRGALDALVAYEQEVVFGYEVTLAKAPLRHGDRATLTRFRDQAAQAAGALGKALEGEGGTPPPAPDPKAAPPQADRSRRGYLRSVITVEEAAVASCFSALGQLADERHIRGSAAFMAQAGRRLVVLRDMSGQGLLPRAFETGA